jgi:fructosamine-3-kinase
VNEALARSLAAALVERVVALRPLAGGDINDAYRVDLAGGRRLFVKTGGSAPRGMYAAERRGLGWIGAAAALRVPRCIAVGDDGEPRFLVLEWIEPGRRAADFEEQFGRGLALLHRAGAPGFGLDHDNFIGTLPQANEPWPTWAEFYGRQRLQPQLERAVAAGRIDGGTRVRLERVIARLAELTGPAESPARLHGDLWSGNVHSDEAGRPCLIDPAA